MTPDPGPTGGALVRINAATDDDAPILTALMHASSAYQGQYASILAGYEITPAQIDRDEMFVARGSNGECLGFYSLTLHPEPELDLFFVADPCRGSGIGSTLFAHFKERARLLQIETVMIVSHPPARPFYEKMGAVEIGMQPPAGRASWPRPVFRVNI